MHNLNVDEHSFFIRSSRSEFDLDSCLLSHSDDLSSLHCLLRCFIEILGVDQIETRLLDDLLGLQESKSVRMTG